MREGEKIVICGPSECGKSTLTKHLLKDKKRVIVYDVVDEYAARGYVRVTSLKALQQAVIRSGGQAFKIAYHRTDNHLQHIHDLAMLLLKVQQPYKDGRSNEKITLVVEEAYQVAPNHTPRQGQGGFQTITNTGRHSGIEIFCITQKYQELFKTFRENAAVSYYFEQYGEALKEIAKTLRNPSEVEKFHSLAQYQYLRIEKGNISVGKCKA